jgi:hypothetical protein
LLRVSGVFCMIGLLVLSVLGGGAFM